jgi:hypothetical protein
MTMTTRSFLINFRCPGRIRTSTYGSKGRCPAIRRPGKLFSHPGTRHAFTDAHTHNGALNIPSISSLSYQSSPFIRDFFVKAIEFRRELSVAGMFRPSSQSRQVEELVQIVQELTRNVNSQYFTSLPSARIRLGLWLDLVTQK